VTGTFNSADRQSLVRWWRGAQVKQGAAITRAMLARGADLSIVDDDGSTVLFYAGANNDYSKLAYLLQLPEGRALAAHVDDTQCTAHHYAAAKCGGLLSLRLLFDAAPDVSVDMQDKDGVWPALHPACHHLYPGPRPTPPACQTPPLPCTSAPAQVPSNRPLTPAATRSAPPMT
jgi:hypothetical protein